MSLDASDFIDNILDEQARRNAAFAQPDVDIAVEDYQPIPQLGGAEIVGLVETLTSVTLHGPYRWGDPPSQTAYGFFRWGA